MKQLKIAPFVEQRQDDEIDPWEGWEALWDYASDELASRGELVDLEDCLDARKRKRRKPCCLGNNLTKIERRAITAVLDKLHRELSLPVPRAKRPTCQKVVLGVAHDLGITLDVIAV